MRWIEGGCSADGCRESPDAHVDESRVQSERSLQNEEDGEVEGGADDLLVQVACFEKKDAAKDD